MLGQQWEPDARLPHTWLRPLLFPQANLAWLPGFCLPHFQPALNPACWLVEMQKEPFLSPTSHPCQGSALLLGAPQTSESG